MEVDLRNVPATGIERNDTLFYSESASRFIVTVSPSNKEAFNSTMKDHPIAEIGTVVADNTFTVVGLQGNTVVKAASNELRDVWKKTLAF